MRLLLVEDSQRLQRSLSMGLKQAGYVVDVTRVLPLCAEPLNSIKAAATSDVVINHHGWFFHQTYTRIGSQHIMR